MSSTTLRVIAVLLAAGAIVLGYIGYKASQLPPTTTPAETEVAPTEPEQHPVLIASRDIPADQIIQLDQVTTIFLDSQPADSFSTLEAVSGKNTRMVISAGDVILQDHFHDPSSLVTAIGPGERAIAVRVDEVTGVGGFIEPGDRVDVLFFLPSSREAGDDSSAQRILKNVRVLAFGDSVDSLNRDAIEQKSKLHKSVDTDETDESDTDNDEEVSGKKSKTAVLSVAHKDLSSLLLAESTGLLRLALVGDELDKKPKTDVEDKQRDAEASQRQLVTLDKYKPSGQQSVSNAQAKKQVRPKTRPKKVKLHRGTQESTISVSRE